MLNLWDDETVNLDTSYQSLRIESNLKGVADNYHALRETHDCRNNSVNEDLYSSDDELLETLKRQMKRSGTLGDIMNDETFFKSIAINSEKSPAELLLMCFKYCELNNLSITSTVNLLKMTNCICNQFILPETRYFMEKLCCTENLILHAVCYVCTKYLGLYESLNGTVTCDNCDTQIDVSNPSNQCFFAILDPSCAVRDYIQVHENYYDYVVRERIHEKNHLKDIYDGQLYRAFIENLRPDDKHLYASFVFNTDGVPVFKSSNFSIWPIYLMLNEIPAQDRFKSIIPTGLWFGLNKPEMSVFLNAFVDQMNHLSTVGISCIVKNEERFIKLFATTACVDTMARAPMNGSCQFNAFYGCDWCLQRGEYYDGSMRYPFIFPFPESRDHATTILHAKEAFEKQTPIFGIKNASPLLRLKNFDIIKGFTPDYLHHYVSGVVQQFTEYILKYLTNTDIENMNHFLLNMKVPHQIERLSRPFSDRGYWKAKEWENFALYYSVPLFEKFLTNKLLLDHWLLLVNSLHICLGMDITFSELNQANQMLHTFVSKVENYYSLTAMTYNVHQLLHLSESIKNWGPLWAHSTYPFEGANHKLLQAIHSAKGVVLQIIKHINMQRCTQILQNKVYPSCSVKTFEYCEYLEAQSLLKNTLKINNITYLGKKKHLDAITAQKFSLSRTFKVFWRVVIDGCLYMSSKKVNKRSCNYFAQLNNDTFIKINDFLVDVGTKEEKTICQVMKTRSYRSSNIIREIIGLSDEIYINTNNIRRICVHIKIEKKEYIIPVPNLYFY